MYDVTLTSKGQITLADRTAQEIGRGGGQQIYFSEDTNGKVFLRVKQPFEKLRASLPKPKKTASLEDMEEAIRKGWAGEIDV